jgi:transposase-like protein
MGKNNRQSVLNIEDIIQRILDAQSYTEIARHYGVTVGALTHWISSDNQRSARVMEARAATAALWDQKAEELISAAQDPLDLQKAKELAHHYRWRASKIAPRSYGDKVQQEITGADGKPIEQNMNIVVSFETPKED